MSRAYHRDAGQRAPRPGPAVFGIRRCAPAALRLARLDVGFPHARSAGMTECLWVVPRTCSYCSVVVGAAGGASEAWMSGWRPCSALAFQRHWHLHSSYTFFFFSFGC